MNQCVNDAVVAFGLNQVELDIVKFWVFVICVVFAFRWLLGYLNHGLETKEERLARKNPFLNVDLEAESKRRRHER